VIERPRVTQADPAFVEAVANALRQYRDKLNPEGKVLTDVELARRLGVSKSTVSKYLQGKQLIGGEPLKRMLIDLGVAIIYKGKLISAHDEVKSDQLQEPAEQITQQIAFVFDGPCRFNETNETSGKVTVSIHRKEPHQSRVTVQIKVAG
jgi:transcriptional regulator with XRE-family HTH domain